MGVLSIGLDIYIPPAQKILRELSTQLLCNFSRIFRFNLFNASLKRLESSHDEHLAEACSNLTVPFSPVLVLLAPTETEMQSPPSAIGKQAVENISLEQSVRRI